MVYFCSMLSKSDKTKQLIIERSAPIFNTKGYAATSMSDILEATGMAKGGIYGNFDSKDEIAAAAFEYAFQLMRDRLREAIKAEKTAYDKLAAIFRFYKNYSVQPVVEGGCVLLNTAIDSDDHIPFLKQKAASGMKEMLDSLRQIIQRGIEAGEFTASLHAKNEAIHIFSVIEGGIMMSKVLDNPQILNSLLQRLQEHTDNWRT